MDIVGLVVDGLASAVEDIPIIGDIVGFIASLFGNSSASNARIARLETIVSKGSSGYDDFNRADTTTLGRGPSMTADWVTGGNGQALGVQGRAAGLVEALAPTEGRRWARYPTPASSSAMTADTIVDDNKVDVQPCTTIIVAANAAFTEFVYGNVFGTGVYLGRGTRAGNVWTFTDWKQNTTYKVGTAERVEVRASGSGIYQLVVDNTVILEHTDTSGYPIDADHRYVGFAIQCWTDFFQLPQYGWRLSAFSLKSEAGTFTAIETVETIANTAQTTASTAQTTAENAVDTAVTEATAAANAAVGAVQSELDTGLAAVNNRIDNLAGGVVQYTFTTSGTFTKPAGMTRRQVSLIGGSAGGARFRNNPVAGGSGGWTKWEEQLASEVGATETVIVGAGGTGATTDDTLGTAGTGSSVGSLSVGGGQCTSSGPIPGFGTELAYDGSGGRGGSTDSPATNGGRGPYSNGGVVGGAAGSGADGGDGISPGTGQIGPGSGGAGGQQKNGTGDGGNGGNGGYPGGGGGGGGRWVNLGTQGNGGNGAAGYVVIRCYFN